MFSRGSVGSGGGRPPVQVAQIFAHEFVHIAQHKIAQKNTPCFMQGV